ncbi:MAG: alkaline phosphatase family protein [Thermoleophilaceae bacterium]
MRPLAASLFALVLALVALAFSSPVTAATTFQPPPVRHVWVINLENTDYDEAFGNPPSGAPHPYLHDVLPSRGVLLRSYYGIGHNSLPNYIAQASGQAPNPDTQGDCFNSGTEFTSTGTDPHGQAIGQGCVFPSSVKTIADQLDGAGMTWKGYMEGIGEVATPARTEYGDDASCAPHDANTNGGLYAAKHNPYAWFHSLADQPSCAQRVLPLTALGGDLQSIATTPNLSFITPDMCNDGHDCSLDTVDRWLERWVPPILASPAYRQDGMVVVTFDESDTFVGVTASPEDDSACCNEIPGPNSPMPGINGPGGGLIGTVVLSPYVNPGTASDHPYNHYSLLRSLEDLFGITTGGDDGHGHLGFAGSYDATYPGPGAFGCDVYSAFGPCQVVAQPAGPTPARLSSSRPTGPRAADGSARWLNPVPTSNDLTGVSCPTASACFAVGAAGTVVATTDAGSTWSSQASGIAGDLAAISCASASACVAVGDGGTVLASSDAGTTWTTPPSGTSKDLNAVSCTGGGSCHAVGDGGTVLASPDGGQTWTTQTSGSGAALLSVSCPDAATCYAVGDLAVRHESSTNTFYRAGVLKTTDGGATWNILDSAADDFRLHAISCPDASTCYMGGDWSSFYSSADGGGTWTHYFGTGVSRYLGIGCASATSCAAVGSSRSDSIASTSDGKSFSPQDARTSDLLHAVACPTAASCYAVGDRGTIVARSDGTHWSAQTGTVTPLATVPWYPPPARSPQLFGTSCPTASACVAVGDGGAIVATSDAGTSWSTRASPTADRLNAVGCATATDCVAAGDGGTIVATSNGASWSKQPSGTPQGLAGVSCPTAAACFAVGDQGTLLTTTNHGASWRPRTSKTRADLNAISCPTASACVAVGALGTILKTTNGGSSWAAPKSAAVAAYLAGVSCPTTSACFAVGESGLILATTDGGKSWAQKASGVGDELDSIACASATSCVASGSDGTVLSTANGGASWTAQGTGTTRALAAVSCAASTGCIAAGDTGTILAVSPRS